MKDSLSVNGSPFHLFQMHFNSAGKVASEATPCMRSKFLQLP